MTKKKTWKKRIKDSCTAAGTYEPYFDYVIDALAITLETRDEAQKQFKEMGCKPVVEHTNKAGNTNLVKNPALVVINECNAQALSYWKELGLTTKSFHQLGRNGPQQKEGSFEDLLAGIGV